MKKSDIDNLLAEEEVEDVPEKVTEDYPDEFQEYMLEES